MKVLKQKISNGPIQFSKLQIKSKIEEFSVHSLKDQIVCCSNKQILRYDLTKKSIQWKQENSADHCTYSSDNIVWTHENMVVSWQEKLYEHLDTITQIQCDEFQIGITAGHEGLVVLWDFKNNQPIHKFEFHETPITKIFWKNSLLVSCDRGGGVAFWDINKGKIVTARKMYQNRIIDVKPYTDYSKNNLLCFVAQDNHAINFVDMRTNKLVSSVKILQKSIRCMEINNSGFVIVGGEAKNIHIIDICSGFKKKNLFQTTNSTNVLLTLQNIVITGNQDGNLSVLDIDTNKNIYTFGVAKKGNIEQMEWNRHKNKIIVNGSEGILYLMEF